MSRHIVKTTIAEKEATIVIGWDRPLAYYHMVIEQGGDFIWSNLNLPDAFSITSFHIFVCVLGGFGVFLPQDLLDELECDKFESPGASKVKDWGFLGDTPETPSGETMYGPGHTVLADLNTVINYCHNEESDFQEVLSGYPKDLEPLGITRDEWQDKVDNYQKTGKDEDLYGLARYTTSHPFCAALRRLPLLEQDRLQVEIKEAS